jgi:hypothetical protein
MFSQRRTQLPAVLSVRSLLLSVHGGSLLPRLPCARSSQVAVGCLVGKESRFSLQLSTGHRAGKIGASQNTRSALVVSGSTATPSDEHN